MPLTVLIPAASTSAMFPDQRSRGCGYDGPQAVSITAQVVHWTAGTDQMWIQDNEDTRICG